jgi:undecaprenyl-diphosphatase
MPDIALLANLLAKFAPLGNWLFFILAFVESAPFIGLLIPGATLISVGGFLASQGYLNVRELTIFAALGAIVGDFFSYSLGRWGGPWIRRTEMINPAMLERGEAYFKRHGNISVFWGRFWGPIRAVVPFVAGLSKMKPVPFIFWNILSGIGWAIFNVALGYYSGTLIVSTYKIWSKYLNLIIALILIGGIIYWLIRKRLKQNHQNKKTG